MKQLLRLVSVLLLVAFGTTACSFEFTTAGISGAVLAKGVQGDNYEPVNPTNTFGTDQDEIHLVANVVNAPSDTKVKVVWIAVDVGDAAPADYRINEYELTVDGSRAAHFSMTRPDSGWPVGKYKAEVYLNGKLDRTLEFTVA